MELTPGGDLLYLLGLLFCLQLKKLRSSNSGLRFKTSLVTELEYKCRTGTPRCAVHKRQLGLGMRGLRDGAAGRIRHGKARRSGSRRPTYISYEIRLLNCLPLRRQGCWGPGWMEGMPSFEESLTPFKFCTVFLTYSEQ